MKTRKKTSLSYEEMSDDEDFPPTATPQTSKYHQKIESIKIKEEIQLKEEYMSENESDLNDEDISTDYNRLSSNLENINKKSISKTEIGDKCEFISFNHGNLKLFVNGHSYFINRTCDNIFNWQCDHDKDCINQAVTMLVNEEHFLKSLDEHGSLAKQYIENQFWAGNEPIYEKCQCITTLNCNSSNEQQMKLIRNGYFYNKSDNIDNIYYWSCEKVATCNGKIITIYKNGEHFLKISKEHNHLNDLSNYKYIEDVENDNDIERIGFSQDDDDDEMKNYSYNHNFEPEVNLNISQEKDKNIILKNEINDNSDIEDENSNDPSYLPDHNDDEDEYDEDPLNVVTAVGDVVCDFVLSNQGNPKLCLNGYLLNRNRLTNNQYYWNCEYKKTLKCYGFAVTEMRDGKHYLKKSREHNHEPNSERKKIGQIMERIKKECVALTESSPSEIVDKELLKVPEDVKKSMPRRDAILRMVNRKRRIEEIVNGTDYKYKPPRALSAKRPKRENNTDCDSIGQICELVESTKGNGKLIAQDYLHTLNKNHNNLFYWRCEQRKSDDCMGYAVTMLINGCHYLKTFREHTHEVNPNRKVIARIMKSIKDSALATDEQPMKIVSDAIENLDEETAKLLPLKRSIIRTINRLRMIHKINQDNVNDNLIWPKEEPDEKTHLFEVNIPVGSECNLFTPTNKGNLKLNLNGFFYHKNRIKNDLHYWQCEENRLNHCRGFATTFVNPNDGKHYIKNIKNHNHPPEEKRQDVADILFKIKEKAKETDLDATLIWNDEVANLPDDLKTLMPQRTAIMTMINRTRRKNMDPDELELTKKIEYDEEQEHIYEINKLADTECEFVASERGFDKLVIEGYLFTRNKVFNNIHKWRCDEQHKDTANCRGYATTVCKSDGKHFLKNAKNHNHPANTHRFEIATIMNRIKDRARTTQDASTKIYDEEIASVSEELKTFVPNREAILCLINRHRRKILEQKKSPPKNLIKQESLTADHFHEPFVEPGSEVEIITSHKGTCKLNLNGYLYVKNVVKNNVHYWQCDEKNLNHCRGHATTIEETNGKHYLRTTRAHNHLAKAGNHREIADAMNRIKEICLVSDDGPKKIYADVVGNLPKDLKSALPGLQAITMIIKRHRRKFRPLDKSGLNYQPQKIYPPEIVEIVDRMKQKILTTTDGPARIYNAEIANLSTEIRDQLPKRENLLQTLKRTRRKSRMKGMYPKEEPFDEDDSGGDDDAPSSSNTATILPSTAVVPMHWWTSS